MAARKKQTLLDISAEFIRKTVVRITGALQNLNSKRTANLLLILAALLYLAVQLSLTFPKFDGSNPIRDDDSYGFMLKASELSQGCFLQDCPALKDLREQFTFPTNNVDVAAYQNRIYHRVFVVYHPLHSFAMAGLGAMGISMETAYDLIYAAGLVFVHLALIYWIYAHWGASTTALTLLLLTPVLFTNSGLHQLKMHTLAVGFALLLWAELARRTSRVHFLMIPLILVMILVHPLGKILALVSVAVYLLNSEWPLVRKAWIISGISLGIILLSFILPEIISAPELRFDPVEFYPGSWDYWAALGEGWKSVWTTIQDWAGSFGSALILVAGALIGILAIPLEKRKTILTSAIFLFGLLLVGAVYVVPWYGAISFPRVWMLAGTFLTAAFASGLMAILAWVAGSVKRTNKKSSSLTNGTQLLSDQGWTSFAIAGAVLMTVVIGAIYFLSHFHSYNQYALARPEEGDYINQGQLDLIDSVAENDPAKTILYMDEFGLEYYLTYGALDYGAVYERVLRSTPELEKWLQLRQRDISFLVNRNPLFQLPHTPEGGILLTEGSILEISGLANEGNRQLLLTSESDATLRVHYGEAESEVEPITIPAGSARWFLLRGGSADAETLVIELRRGSGSVEIRGLRFNEDSQTLWPWDQGISLGVTEHDGKQHQLDLNSEQLAAPLLFDMQVIDDRGFLILVKINQ